MRFGFEYINMLGKNVLQYNYGYNGWNYTEIVSEWGYNPEGHTHIQLLDQAVFTTAEDVYYTICLDCENLIQKYFINGVKIGEVSVTRAYIDRFKELEENRIDAYNLGRSSMSIDGYWHYGGMNCYSLRLYNRSLTDNEALANYNATVSYHQFLLNGGNASTGGNTGGEDLGTIE